MMLRASDGKRFLNCATIKDSVIFHLASALEGRCDPSNQNQKATRLRGRGVLASLGAS